MLISEVILRRNLHPLQIAAAPVFERALRIHQLKPDIERPDRGPDQIDEGETDADLDPVIREYEERIDRRARELHAAGRTLLITRADVFAIRDGKWTLCAVMQQTIMALHGRKDSAA